MVYKTCNLSLLSCHTPSSSISSHFSLPKVARMSEKRPSPSNNKDNKYMQDEMMELRRGPWTLEEDALLMHYIACHGEGRWNLLARSSGLKRTGKSCRLRWLNYLKPDIKRGNLSPEEQFLILELHSKWGNRWSRIAQHLPGRTDNEIKNYWRTRVQKQARQLKIDANSAMFRDAVRCYWMPRLLEKMSSSASNSIDQSHLHPNSANTYYQTIEDQAYHHNHPHPSAEHDDHYYMYDSIPNMQCHQSYENFSSSFSGLTCALQNVPNNAYNYEEMNNCNTFNQISSNCEEEEKPYNLFNNSGGSSTVTPPPMSASGLSHSLSDCTTTADHDNYNNNNFIMNSIDGAGGDNNLWCMDELYGMLKGYLNGVDSEVDPFF